MPLYLLQIKAELENIASIQPKENNLWKLNIVSSGGDSKDGITVSGEDIIELEGSKGE